MVNILLKILSITKDIWHFLVESSNIISCVAAVLSCYIAYTAVSEIISLNIELSPMIERIQKDSIIFIERPTPLEVRENITNEQNPASEEESSKFEMNDNTNDEQDSGNHYINKNTLESIRADRESFFERMRIFFGH